MSAIIKPQENRFFVSSWHNRSPIVNVLGVTEKIETVYPDGTSTWADNLRLYHDPIRPFWVTKPEYRTHLKKKEFEDVFRCDVFYVNDSQLEVALTEAINYPVRFSLPSLRQLCSSPYVYGADVDTQTIVRQRYNRESPIGKIPPYTRGALDIEAEPIRMGRINLITFIHENCIYTTALRDFCKIWNTEQTKWRPALEEDFIRVISEMLGSVLDQHKFTLKFRIFDTELEMIEWTFKHIHEHKTNFVGIWNLGFDIPKIIERVEVAGAHPSQILSHPAIPEVYRFCDFFEDKSEVQHITDRWHWFTLAGYTQFIDSMCLYARLRKASGRESSYSLDEISSKEVGRNKLHFGAITNHWYMQKYKFLEYAAYNINDVLIMMLMEWQNNDMSQAAGLASKYLLNQFNRQTVMVKNNAYDYSRYKGKMPASAGTRMFSDYEMNLPKAGGAVLPPNKAVGVGVEVVLEYDANTLVSILTNDLDVSSMYPSIIAAFNIAKETTIGTAINMRGRPHSSLELFFSAINQTEINAVDITNEYFGLPNYTQMQNIYREYLHT